MVKLFKLHKFFGLLSGFVLLILGISGFFIDHKEWSFLYNITFKHLPQAAYDIDRELYDGYYIDSKDSEHRIVCAKRGIFESFDDGETFKNISHLQCNGIREFNGEVYIATNDGIKRFYNFMIKGFALNGEYITAISITEDKVIAVIDKHYIVDISKSNPDSYKKYTVEIDENLLRDDIKLSRFVRDLHYGRGLLDDGLSLWINDYGALILSLLAISGYMIWWYVHRVKRAKRSRKIIKWHANIWSVIALIPLVVLAITGIFLDHSSGLAKFMRLVTIPHEVLPPVYSTLRRDIWSVDYDGSVYRVGNRYGVYKSTDLKNWEQDSKGLAFRMFRKGGVLYVSGMGAPNRIHDENGWHILKGTPHMFRDVMVDDGFVEYFSPRSTSLSLPTFDDATLYALMMSLHDGTFFASWWIWVNDFVSIALFLLFVTGIIRWYKKRSKSLKAP